jgi:hypothetical protein
MPATINELVTPRGTLGVQDAVRLAAFGIVLSTMAASSGGGSGTASPRPAPGERSDAPERQDAPERVG